MSKRPEPSHGCYKGAATRWKYALLRWHASCLFKFGAWSEEELEVMQDTLSTGAYAALRDWRFFEVNDVDEAQARIASVLHPHRLIPGRQDRRGSYQMDFLRLSGLGFAAISHAGEMGLDSSDMIDYHLILLCPIGSGQVRVGNKAIDIDGRRGFACNPGQAFQASFSVECEQFVVRIDTRALHAHSGKQKLRLKPEVDLSSPNIQPFVGLLQMLLSDRRLLGLARNNFRIAAEYEQLLLSLLLAGQPHADAEKERTGGIAPATVRRAESFIRDHASESLTLLSIADAVGVPPRTLLEGFHRFRDKSPMKYLRDVRLDMARERLIETRTESRIAEIAIECGFGHLSRFARDYMRRFGEKPSQTLAQKKRLVAV